MTALGRPSRPRLSHQPAAVENLVLGLPFLVAVAPILLLWSANAQVVRPQTVVAPLLIVLVATAASLIGLSVITRQPIRSAVTIAVIWVPILTFGYQLSALSSPYEVAVKLVLLLGNIGGAAALIALSWSKTELGIFRYASVAAGLLVVSTVPGIVAGISVGGAPTRVAGETSDGGPDVYYIVLDAYARADVLSEIYDFDNDPFLGRLRDRGFYVADGSHSNYAMTHLSLPATLNMNYLPVDAPYNLAFLDRRIQDAAVIHEFQERGYRYVFFQTPSFATDDAPLADRSYGQLGMQSEFEATLFRTTLPGSFLPPTPRHSSVLAILSELPLVAEDPGPTFTFAHLLIPHPPFMFDAEGRVLDYVDDFRQPFIKTAYVNQLTFVNREIEQVIDRIVASSDRKPVIIIQGDHGPAAMIDEAVDAETVWWERLSILNAMLVPPAVEANLYPSISPVNTYRVLLNGLFDEYLPLLPDQSFYNWYNPVDSPAVTRDPLALRDVTDQLR